jgi:anti-sigma regulatory factor (Ser/Thr protein kinase)
MNGGTIMLPRPGTWQLPHGPEAAAAARTLVRAWLAPWTSHAPDMVANAVLAVSELATNAAEHGAPPVLLAMSAENRGAHAVLTAVVHDGGAQLPHVFKAKLLDEHHRGLLIIEAVTARWGVRDAADGGKDVWFEIAVPADGPQVPAAPRVLSSPERTVEAAAGRASAIAGPARQEDGSC